MEKKNNGNDGFCGGFLWLFFVGLSRGVVKVL